MYIDKQRSSSVRFLKIKKKIERYLRVRYVFKTTLFMLLDWLLLLRKKNKIKSNTLLIIRTDAIGDYLLFRNFLEVIRNSSQYGHYKITLCGNSLWKSLANEIDYKFVDEFIFIDPKKLSSDWKYRRHILGDIFNKGFETVIYPSYSREYLSGDALVRSSKAPTRIGSVSNASNDFGAFRLITSGYYTSLIKSGQPNFEFDKSILFFEELLRTKLKIQSPSISIKKNKQATITLFPGAGELERQWNPLYFAEVADYLAQKHANYTIQICGAPNDKELAIKIIENCLVAHPKDYTGQTTLVQLLEIINETKILITNESSALHMGASTHTHTIALLTGKHYKRFSPYSQNHSHLHFVYPLPLSFYDAIFNKYGSMAFDDVVSNINDIKPEVVKQLCSHILDET